MLIDVGVNLLNRQFHSDRNAVMQRAKSAGVEEVVVIATNLDESADAIDLVQHSGLRCTAGVHPHDAAAVPGDWQVRLQHLASHPRVCAVGETGLDFHRNFSPAHEQREVFAAQIDLAQTLQKPLYVHDRDSQGEVMDLLSAVGPLPPVLIHCFTGSARDLENYLHAGFHIGITGWITDQERGGSLRALVPEIPAERLMLETDAPFLRPTNVPARWLQQYGLPLRYKRRCEPAMLPFVLHTVAALRGEEPADLAAITRANAIRFFGLAEPHAPAEQ